MNNDDKILKALEVLQADVTSIKGDITILKSGQAQLKTAVAQMKTAIEAVKAGQDDIRDTMATEARVMDLGAKVDRITRNHERRIEELEDHAGLPNPHKN